MGLSGYMWVLPELSGAVLRLGLDSLYCLHGLYTLAGFRTLVGREVPGSVGNEQVAPECLSC